jgi:hypothetical protein
MNAVTTEVASRELAPTRPTDNMLEALARAASDPSVDAVKLEQLWKIHEAMRESRAKSAFVEAMAHFKRNPPMILKAKAVEFTTQRGTTSYKHATLAMVCRAVVEALSKFGISHRWSTEQMQGGRIRVTCVLTHELGHSESTTLEGSPDDSGGKNAIQAIGSAVTYLQRYTLLAACGLATDDMDDHDGRAPGGTIGGEQLITESQAADLLALIQENGRDLARFLKWARVERLDQIPARKYQGCVDAVRSAAR